MEYASKTEAINGADNTKIMTPLRVKQSILANSQSSGGSDNYMDPVPINSIFDYEGDTVPDGFVEIDPVVIPTKTSDLTNDSGFIDNKVNDLINYTKTSDLNNALDLKANASDLENIKSAIDYKPTGYIGDLVVENVVSRNLFNKNDIIYNYKLDEYGNIIPSAGDYGYNEKYINCSGHKKLIISGASATSTGYLIFYDNNKNYIDWFGFQNRTIDIPSNAVYFRVSCDTSYLDTLQIEFEEQTPYVPYLNLEEAMQENEVYSTSEIRIGTWLGKPLYRKIIHLTSGWELGQEKIINHNIPNIDKVIYYKGVCRRSDKTDQIIPNVHSNMEYWGSSCYDFNNTTFTLYIGTLAGIFSIENIDITLEYTKTTD